MNLSKRECWIRFQKYSTDFPKLGLPPYLGRTGVDSSLSALALQTCGDDVRCIGADYSDSTTFTNNVIPFRAIAKMQSVNITNNVIASNDAPILPFDCSLELFSEYLERLVKVFPHYDFAYAWPVVNENLIAVTDTVREMKPADDAEPIFSIYQHLSSNVDLRIKGLPLKSGSIAAFFSE